MGKLTNAKAKAIDLALGYALLLVGRAVGVFITNFTPILSHYLQQHGLFASTTKGVMIKLSLKARSED
jgi:hypothetical protein